MHNNITIMNTPEQHSNDWYRARLGHITGSKVGCVMKAGRTKDKPFSDTALTYIYEVAGERMLNPDMVSDDLLFGMYLDVTTASSKAMRWGSEQEENARALYEELTGITVEETGCTAHPNIEYFASSPDGLVADNGMQGCIEIKCPQLATFAKYVKGIKDADSLLAVNADYYWQCMAHMAVTGAGFCDFIVYSPFVVHPLHKVRVMRDEDAIAKMEERVMMALEVVKNLTDETNTDNAVVD